MKSSNWVSCGKISIDNRNSQYRVDNVGLQLRLGLPVELIGGSSVEFDRSRFNGQRFSGPQPPRGNNSQREPTSEAIQQTVDGISVRKVYITNICLKVDRREISLIFGRFGQIMNIFLGVSKNDHFRKFAFVTFADPKAAARVLSLHKFQDTRGNYMYAMAADSWHQPKEDAKGKVNWKVDLKMKAKQVEENEEDDRSLAEEGDLATEEELGVDEEGLNVLNDDCLLHILSFLSFKQIAGVERVCKRWQGLSYRMWRCLHKLSYVERTLPQMEADTNTLEAYLRRCGPSLRELDLAVSIHSFNESTLAIIAKQCHNLEVLRVANLEAGNRSLAHLGRSCPKLKELVMDGCAMFNDKDMMSLLPKCPHLSVLVLSHNSFITGKCLTNVKSTLSSLQLRNLPSLEPAALIAGLQGITQSLESLTLNACGNLRSGEVGRIVSAVPNLTSLSLSQCLSGMQLDPNSLTAVGQLKKLTKLNFTHNSAVNDKVLTAIIEGCEGLTDINLCGSGGGCVGLLSEQGLSTLARLRQLTHLDLSYLEATTDTTLKTLSSRNPRLQELTCRGCPDLTDEGCIQVVTMCNDLKMFDISGCNNVTDLTIYAAKTSVKMRTNNVPLTLIAGGTDVNPVLHDPDVPKLTVDMIDLSEEHLRPDFIDDMFFPPSDSDEEEDLDHLSFSFEDLNSDHWSTEVVDYDSVCWPGYHYGGSDGY